ncbi:putative cyclin-dependent kinase F-2 [Miscanthus floridulus]|uniref:putative cyclin-dependent kinase F-2 n=1 Tax=Miscanthus floridulus TaxID=154761 RepID=UPI0034594897
MLAACAGNPAVVRLREVARGSDMHDLHLVMEYVVGRSLQDVITSLRRRHRHQHHPFSESETRRVMAQLLAGVSTMHAHGVVHRDLKPGNVLVSAEDGHLKICDLGLATSVVAPLLTDDTDPEGTPGYMAPELLLGEKDCGVPIDVWALGCNMAVLVTGQTLFPEEDLCQQLISIVNLLGIPDDVSLMPLGVSGPSKLRERVPKERLSQEGFDVLEGLLEYNPMDRLTAVDALKMPWFAAKDD